MAKPLTENKYAALIRAFSLKTYLHLFIIAVIGTIAYSNTFHSPFVLDDIKEVKENQMIRNIDNFRLALKGHDFGSGAYRLRAYRYIPSRFVGYLSFALNYHFGGVDVTGYHAVNLTIHILNSLLVYFFIALTFKTPYFKREASVPQAQKSIADPRFTIHDSRPVNYLHLIALFSALLFVSHPLQTQAVTYIVQRFASLAVSFYLLSIVLYIKGRIASQRQAERGSSFLSGRSVLFFLVSLVSAALAMRTKEIAFTLPFVIILYESVFFASPLKKKLLFLLPVALTLIIVPLSIMHIDKPLGEILSDIDAKTRLETTMPRWDYLMTEMRVVTTYIRLIFLPINQNLDYDYPAYHSFFDPPVFLSFLFLSALFAMSVYLLYKARPGKERDQGMEQEAGGTFLYAPYYRLIGFGILWFFITLSVESSIIPIDDLIFEHRVYLPLVGFLTAITAGIFLVAVRFKTEKSIALILVLIILALSAATYARNNVWKDEVSLWEDVARKSPNWDRPHNNLGSAYYIQGRVLEAMREFQTAVSLNYNYADAHNNLGVVYEEQGQLDKAKNEFQAAVNLKPDNPDMHYNLGRVYERQGFPYDAINEYKAVLKLNPDYASARTDLEALTKRMGSK